MATRIEGKPELENGYTKIANELLDALIKVTFRPSERQVFDCILRQTYGWNKKEEKISVSQIVEVTKLSRRTVIYAVQNLEARNMVTVLRSKAKGSARNLINVLKIQKIYSKWVVQGIGVKYAKLLEKQRLKYKEKTAGVVQGKEIESKVVQGTENKGKILAPIKDIKDKDIKKVNQRKKLSLPENEKRKLHSLFSESLKDDKNGGARKTKTYSADSTEIQLAAFLCKSILNSPLWIFQPKLPATDLSRELSAVDTRLNPAATKALQKWAHQFHLLLNVDKHSTCEIERIIRIATNDGFWFKNIRSPKKLRKHWDSLQVIAAEALAKVPGRSKKPLILRICSECGHRWDNSRSNSMTCLECHHFNKQYLDELRRAHCVDPESGPGQTDKDQRRLDALTEKAGLTVHQGG